MARLPHSPEHEQMLQRAKAHYLKGALHDATAICRQVLEADPGCAEAMHLAGLLAFRSGKLETAEDFLRLSISFNRKVPSYYSNLAQVLQATGRIDDAVEFCQRAVDIAPSDFQSHFVLGKMLRSARRLPEAIAAYRKSLELNADNPPAHSHLSMALLLSGDFENGWPELEWRWERPEVQHNRPRFAQPQWDGSPLNGQRILLHSEQGFGDTLHFCRYASLVAKLGGKVILQCQPELARLMKSLQGVEQLITDKTALPEFDLHCPMMSLPLAFKTTLQTIPADVPYLAPDPSNVEHWRSKIEAMPELARLKIGVVWSGRTTHKVNGMRSLSFQTLSSTLFKLLGAQFFSLQKGGGAEQLKSVDSGTLIDWTGELIDFADTAALLQNLDLLITVDTSVAHLAGAIGKKVWVLLGYIPDWRWMLDRDDSPWYPSMTLFRQPAPDDWQSPLEQIVQRLQELGA